MWTTGVKKMGNSVSLYGKEDWKRRGQPQKTKTEDYRSEVRRDLGRLVHSASFRRLQGKTQLFPNADSDFFRNRLTHSIEVAQIAKAIATKLNNEREEFQATPIDLDLVEFAGLAHDLGHPPFGHIGEEALDQCMLNLGGFEGNAQTLRILSRLEKRDVGGDQTFDSGLIQPIVDGEDLRLGLNTTCRSMASILKYDIRIEERRKSGPPVKGYYYFDDKLVEEVKDGVARGSNEGQFKTIECAVMDIADDIAYSTYDLEDAFKGKVLSPLELLKLTTDENLFERIAEKVTERLVRFGYRSSASSCFTAQEAVEVVDQAFGDLFRLNDTQRSELETYNDADKTSMLAKYCAETSDLISSDGYYRTNYTSQVIQEALEGVELIYNEKQPALSEVRLAENIFCRVEVMKNLTYEIVIRSPPLKLIEFRGKKIIEDMFHALSSKHGDRLLPDDHRHILYSVADPSQKKRVVCDFIAGMTDRYALEFYQRLFGASPSTIFKQV